MNLKSPSTETEIETSFILYVLFYYIYIFHFVVVVSTYFHIFLMSVKTGPVQVVTYTDTYGTAIHDHFEVSSFKLGDTVEVFQNKTKKTIFSNGSNPWKTAQIINIRFGCMYDVQLDNGDILQEVKPYMLRKVIENSKNFRSNSSDLTSSDVSSEDYTRNVPNIGNILSLRVEKRSSWFLFSIVSDTKEEKPQENVKIRNPRDIHKDNANKRQYFRQTVFLSKVANAAKSVGRRASTILQAFTKSIVSTQHHITHEAVSNTVKDVSQAAKNLPLDVVNTVLASTDYVQNRLLSKNLESPVKLEDIMRNEVLDNAETTDSSVMRDPNSVVRESKYGTDGQLVDGDDFDNDTNHVDNTISHRYISKLFPSVDTTNDPELI